MVRKIILFVLCIITLLPVQAQFYNGMQTNFGKNRVQYNSSYWHFYRFADYDVYYDMGGRTIAEFVARKATYELQYVADFLDIQFDRRLQFIVYNSIDKFIQSNIGLNSADEQYNVGGTTQIIDNKIILYYTGNYDDLLVQMRREIARLYLQDFLYETDNYRQMLSNSTQSELPIWIVNSLAMYVAQDWGADIEKRIAQLLYKKNIGKILNQNSADSEIIGFLLWKYIKEHIGSKEFTYFVQLLRLTNNVEISVEYATNMEYKEFLKKTIAYYKTIVPEEKKQQDNHNSIPLKRIAKQYKIADMKLSPDASKLVYVANKYGKTKIFLYDIHTRRTQKIFKSGVALEQVIDYNSPCIAWTPQSKAFSFFSHEKGYILFYTYIIESETLLVRRFHHFEKIYEFSYSPDGSHIVFSGLKDGRTDIYTYSIQTYNNYRITDNDADNRYPTYSIDGKKIIYSSNQHASYGIPVRPYNLYEIPTQGKFKTEQLLKSESEINEITPYMLSQDDYIYLSDNYGKNALYSLVKDSVLVAVDTALHYEYSERTKKIFDADDYMYSYSLAPDAKKIAILTQNNKKNTIGILALPADNYSADTLTPSYFMQQYDSLLHVKHTSQSLESLQNYYKDHPTVNYMAYSFEYENHANNSIVDSVFNTDSLLFSNKIPYHYTTNFYINQVVNQVDFGFINTSYQAFTGSAFYYMPGINAFFKFGAIDLFENYRLTGGVRFSGNFQTNEFLVSLENLKYRWDKQYLLHKQTMITASEEAGSRAYLYHRIIGYNFIAIYKYPLNQVEAFIISPRLQYNRDVILSVDMYSLQQPEKQTLSPNLVLQYIYDNTKELSLNILKGSRAKAFAEFYTHIPKMSDYLSVIGFDARHYQPLYDKIIIAQRLAYSYSFGSAALLYYLGGVDNWVNLFPQYEVFNTSIEYDRTIDWKYQAIGTNMRGFGQNIRNGPSFAVSNTELRIPIIQTILQRTLRTDFINQLQCVGFVDMGAAWSGLYPGAKPNAYNFTIIHNNPIHVEIDESRSPFVYGYGYGLRTRLFGYFLRLDWAYGVENRIKHRMFHLSLSLDF